MAVHSDFRIGGLLFPKALPDHLGQTCESQLLTYSGKIDRGSIKMSRTPVVAWKNILEPKAEHIFRKVEALNS